MRNTLQVAAQKNAVKSFADDSTEAASLQRHCGIIPNCEAPRWRRRASAKLLESCLRREYRRNATTSHDAVSRYDQLRAALRAQRASLRRRHAHCHRLQAARCASRASADGPGSSA